ncbi:MAG: hypothetical protein KVP17_005210 [Porospora cf. gigantea B]|uniref:uncharacterized protein n=1 Tax=Porospora cf. gigantea B TaxID=2853592 RepID=UPI00357194D6|nr:MAG: hypothetical protein KVP17_005210 [Porospora cf. gigantea B]
MTTPPEIVDHSKYEVEDELEEFEELGEVSEKAVDPQLENWGKEWDSDITAFGWDEADKHDDFIQRLKQELEAFKNDQSPESKQGNSGL